MCVDLLSAFLTIFIYKMYEYHVYFTFPIDKEKNSSMSRYLDLLFSLLNIFILECLIILRFSYLKYFT